MTASRHVNATHYFDLSTALQLASAAELVYADPRSVERTVTAAWRYSHFCFLDVEATQCLVAADAESILVCFRGTEADRPRTGSRTWTSISSMARWVDAYTRDSTTH